MITRTKMRETKPGYTIEIIDDYPEMYHQLTIGDTGTLVTDTPQDGNRRAELAHFPENSFYMSHDPDGVPGNMNPAIKIHAGWRGTSNGIDRVAHGVCRVESIEPRKRGVGIMIKLSKINGRD